MQFYELTLKVSKFCSIQEAFCVDSEQSGLCDDAKGDLDDDGGHADDSGSDNDHNLLLLWARLYMRLRKTSIIIPNVTGRECVTYLKICKSGGLMKL